MVQGARQACKSAEPAKSEGPSWPPCGPRGHSTRTRSPQMDQDVLRTVRCQEDRREQPVLARARVPDQGEREVRQPGALLLLQRAETEQRQAVRVRRVHRTAGGEQAGAALIERSFSFGERDALASARRRAADHFPGGT